MPSTLNLVFCGTPRFAVPTLERLVDAGFPVRLVVTQPDKPRGRGLEVALSPVKQSAMALGLPLLQPEKIRNNDEFRSRLTALNPDAIIVVGYGRILPQWMIDLPQLGNINLHASLLPKYRGAAPIQWAIASGEAVTGVTTMRIDAGLDTGDILQQQESSIAPADTSETGTVHPHPQDSSKSTLAPILKKEDGRIDFHRTAPEICNRLRGFQPWPGAFTGLRGKTLQVWDARPIQRNVTEGELLTENDQLLVGCGKNTALDLLEIQIEGKKRMAARDFIHGYHPAKGERLGH
jgi:methionyl-tRNA formyltransferase